MPLLRARPDALNNRGIHTYGMASTLVSRPLIDPLCLPNCIDLDPNLDDLFIILARWRLDWCNANANVSPGSTCVSPELGCGREWERDHKAKGVDPKAKTKARDSEPSKSCVHFTSDTPSLESVQPPVPRVRTPGPKVLTPTRAHTPSPRLQSPVGHSSPLTIASSNATRDTSPGHKATLSTHEVAVPEPAPKPQPVTTVHSTPRPHAIQQRDSSSTFILNPEWPKSAAMTPSLAVPPHVNISTSPVNTHHEQQASLMNAKTSWVSALDPERTPRAPVHQIPEPTKPESSPPPRVDLSPNQAHAHTEVENSKRQVKEDLAKQRVDEEASKRRVDVAMGATVAATAAEVFGCAGSKKRNKDAELSVTLAINHYKLYYYYNKTTTMARQIKDQKQYSLTPL
ncbi:hypothetical protein FRC07_009987 [Ceratobasidium sp. 392]|nr:hypothetical protein FRC07_009987 [Ceratobasidium sp. 392]